MTAWHVDGGPERIALAGELAIPEAAAIWRALQQRTRSQRQGTVELDLSRATAVDGTIVGLLVELRAELAARGVRAEITGAPPHVAAIVHLYGGDRPPPRTPGPHRERLVARFGSAIAFAGGQLRRAIDFAGELVVGFGTTLRRPALGGWRDLPSLVARAGTDGIPIVLVLDFLVGFVIAFQSTRLLTTYGANLYVADIVGVSMTRELAPLITAIIISGRSGAGFAAELGTMRVNEEIDALRTLGIAPVPYLVVPRVLALALAAPALALLGDIAGVCGGAVVGAASLDVERHAFLAELRAVLVSSDVWTGLVKSAVFGVAIAIIGCHQGLSTRGAASGVGRSTTTTVVACLFALVVLDTALTVLFRGVGA